MLGGGGWGGGGLRCKLLWQFSVNVKYMLGGGYWGWLLLGTCPVYGSWKGVNRVVCAYGYVRG